SCPISTARPGRSPASCCTSSASATTSAARRRPTPTRSTVRRRTRASCSSRVSSPRSRSNVAGYRSWKDLPGAEPAPAPAVGTPEPPPAEPAAESAATSNLPGELATLLAERRTREPPTLESLLEQGLLPPELEQALDEYHGLRRQLDQMTGKGEADPELERRQRCFPVEVHSKHSRIAQRRARRGEERARQASARELQEQIVEQRQEQRESERRDLRARTRRVARAMRARSRLRRRAAELEQRLSERRREAQSRALITAHQQTQAERERESNA